MFSFGFVRSKMGKEVTESRDDRMAGGKTEICKEKCVLSINLYSPGIRQRFKCVLRDGIEE